MTDSLRTAFRDAAASAGQYGDATQAIAAASRRRRGRILAGSGAAAAAAVAVVAVGATSLSSSTPTPPAAPGTPSSQGTTDITTNQPTTVATTATEQENHGVRMNGAAAPVALLYRECRAGDCEVGIVDDSNQHLDLPDQLAEPLAEHGFEGVTLSTDGAWIGYPHDGTFTVASVYGGGLSVDVPAGPPGSTWRPYFWSQGYLNLVLAQWTGDEVTAFAIVHVGYTEDDTPEFKVVVEPAPTGDALLPVAHGSAYYNVLSVADLQRVVDGGPWPIVQTLQERGLFTGESELEQPGLSPPGRVRDLGACMHDDETLIGPDGVAMTFVVAPETSSDQDGATVVFRPQGDGVVPSGVVKGWCSSEAAAPGTARYNLPRSSWTDGWTFLGPVDQESSLMLHQTDISLDGELVIVGADGRQTVVGQLPFRTEVLAPGMTGGMFE